MLPQDLFEEEKEEKQRPGRERYRKLFENEKHNLQ